MRIKEAKTKKDIILISSLCLLFLLIGLVATRYEYYNYAYIPLIVLGLIFIIYKFYYSLFLVALLTPFSLFEVGDAFSISIPTEPILILVMLIFVWECTFNRNYDKKYLKHPISKMIIINLSWMLVSAIFSWDFLISIKYIISRLWFVIPCFFMGILIFKDIKNIKWFIALYGFSLSVIVIISTIKYALTGFNHEYANYIVCPFYNDHTAYGAAVSLFIPICLYYLFAGKDVCPKVWEKVLFGFIVGCLFVGLILSYARAAWIGIFVALVVFVLIKMKIKLRVLLMILFGAGVIAMFSWTTILQKLQMNNQDSSGNIAEHISSMSNISTDASNVERLNRWASAFRMLKERPITGWGCGTYQFVYASFQHSSQRTPISTNEGTLGNAHSEYIGPLCEQGYIGCLIVIVMFATTIYVGIRTFNRSKDKNIKNLSLFIMLSLITYYTHGFMNDFLDTDKLSVPFWAMTAMIVALDMYSENKEKISENKEKIK